MGKQLKFGGPGLPEGKHTYYQNTKTNAIVNVKPGDVVDVELVAEAAENYVQRGQASFVESSK